MNLVLNEFYHIYNRGNNRQNIFFSDANYLFFLKKIRNQLSPVSNIIAWCLMPNHFHLIIRATEQSVKERTTFGGKPMQEFPYQIGILLSSYSQAINKQNKTTGSLFQQKTKAKILSEQINNRKESYLKNCFFYLIKNPFKSGLVTQLSDWPYSCFLDFTSKRKGTLCNKKLLFAETELSVEDIISESGNDLSDDMIRKLY